MMDLRAHAKINLHLHSVQRREDGYHELDTVFCHLDLHDDVHVALRQGVIELESQTGLSVTEDLAGRAATGLQAELGDAALGCALRIIKRIPAGGGLGGGSADAAAVLRGLAELWSAPPATVASLAAQLGADVPFLLKGGLARAGGVGDELTPLATPLHPAQVTLLFPGVPVSTPEAYRWLDEDGLDRDQQGARHLERLLAELQTGSANFIKYVYNSFDAPVCRRVPEVRAAFQAAQSLGLRPLLCGSGSTVAAFGRLPGGAKEALRPFQPITASLAGFAGPYT